MSAQPKPAEKLVSVIIPSYNRGYCLPKTIASVLAQTHQNFEIIIVDDGSTDGTEQTIQKHYPNEPRLRYIRQKNQGVSAARNRGMKEARGELIALLDSDDTWLPCKLEAQLACLKRFPSAVLVHSEMLGIDADDQVFDTQFLRTTYDGYRKFPLTEMYSESCAFKDLLSPIPPILSDSKVWLGDIFSHLLTGNLLHTSNLLITRASDGSIESYDEAMRTEETHDFHLRLAKRGPVAFLDAPLVRYQRGRTDHMWVPGTAVSPKWEHELNCRFLRIIEPHLKAGGTRMRVSKKGLTDSLIQIHGWAADGALGDGQYGEMLHHVGASLRLRPWQPRLLPRLAYKLLFKPRKK